MLTQGYTALGKSDKGDHYKRGRNTGSILDKINRAARLLEGEVARHGTGRLGDSTANVTAQVSH